MDGQDFITAAGKMLAINDEAHFRSAVSRGYYGAFNFARQILGRLGFPEGEKEERQVVVIELFENSGCQQGATIGKKLRTLRNKRVDADYKMDQTQYRNHGNASLAVKSAAQLAQDLQDCLKSPTVEQLKPKIKVQIDARMGRNITPAAPAKPI